MYRLLDTIKGLSLGKKTGLKRTVFYHFTELINY